MFSKLPTPFIESARQCSFELEELRRIKAPYLYVVSNKTTAFSQVPGVIIKTQDLKEGVKLKLVIKKGIKIKKPIFLCFGVLSGKGKQEIFPEIILEEGAEATILAHCTFPRAKEVLHRMTAKINLKKNARLVYREKHYHGKDFGVKVLANFNIVVEEGAVLENEFVLNQGSVGKLDIVFVAELAKDSLVQVFTRIIGKGQKDRVEVKDKILLNGENSRSLMKFKGAIRGGGQMFFRGEMLAKGKNARGHVDCKEIIVGKSIARSIPMIEVQHPEARITHEASVGKVNQKELETLMTRGLSNKEATDFIISGAIK